MCCSPKSLRVAEANKSSKASLPAKTTPNQATFWSLPRLPPLLVVALFPLLPSSCYINRGFTQWFHWMSVFYFLTGSAFVERFQVITGISICLGWYSALGYASVCYGQFFLILYQNMPSALKEHIFVDTGNEIQYESAAAWQMMTLAHVLDLFGHPLLTYYFWRRHKQRGGSAADIFLSWPVVALSYLYSRLWSMTQLLYNTGKPGYFYIGSDVYVMEHVDCWIPAYAAESIFYALVVLYKLLDGPLFKFSRTILAEKSVDNDVPSYESPPKLAYSVSGISRSASMASFDATARYRELASRSTQITKATFTGGTDWSNM